MKPCQHLYKKKYPRKKGKETMGMDQSPSKQTSRTQGGKGTIEYQNLH
jgi:hypothetical protein